MSETINTGRNLISMTSQIVAAYVSHNSVRESEMANLIQSVHGSLFGLEHRDTQPSDAVAPEDQRREGAVSIKKSVHDEYLISMIDGHKYKSLKRHIKTRGFTEKSYKEVFGLPSNYPMVCPAYSRARSQLAKDMQLGQKRKIAREKDALADMDKNDSVVGDEVSSPIVDVDTASQAEAEAVKAEAEVNTQAEPPKVKRGRKPKAAKEAA